MSFARVVLALVFALTACAFPATAGVSGPPIVVGVIISSSGPFASLGGPIRNSIVLAESDINARGGIDGRPISFDIQDDGGKPDTAAQLATAMAARHVALIIGGCITPTSVALVRETTAANLVQIYMSPTAQIWDSKDGIVRSVFEIVPRNEIEMTKLLTYARTQLNAKSIAILHDENSYGSIGATLIEATAKAQNIAVIANEQFATSATDVTPQIVKMRAAKPDVVFMWGVSPAAALALKQMKQLGLTAPVFTSGGNLNDGFLRITGADADGIHSDSSLRFTHPNAAQARYMARYRAAYRERANNLGSYGWDAAQIAALALINAHGKRDLESLENALETMPPYAGSTATYRFSKTDHNGIGPSDLHMATSHNAVWFTE